MEEEIKIETPEETPAEETLEVADEVTPVCSNCNNSGKDCSVYGKAVV